MTRLWTRGIGNHGRFVFGQAKACARPALSLRTMIAEHTLEGVYEIHEEERCRKL